MTSTRNVIACCVYGAAAMSRYGTDEPRGGPNLA